MKISDCIDEIGRINQQLRGVEANLWLCSDVDQGTIGLSDMQFISELNARALRDIQEGLDKIYKKLEKICDAM